MIHENFFVKLKALGHDMKVILDLGNIIQLVSGYTSATLSFVYIYLQFALSMSESVKFTLVCT